MSITIPDQGKKKKKPTVNFNSNVCTLGVFVQGRPEGLKKEWEGAVKYF